jgi:hypothetical protein
MVILIHVLSRKVIERKAPGLAMESERKGWEARALIKGSMSCKFLCFWY